MLPRPSLGPLIRMLVHVGARQPTLLLWKRWLGKRGAMWLVPVPVLALALALVQLVPTSISATRCMMTADLVALCWLTASQKCCKV